MNSIVECVPNFSEGRRPEVVDAIVDAIRSAGGVAILDREMDADHNRCVITFVGPKQRAAEAAFRGIAKGRDLIDLTTHSGGHPRIGAADVVPFIPVKGATMEECVLLAETLGRRVWEELGIPVYLYEAAARRPDRKNLEKIRAGQFEGLRDAVRTDPERRPDFGDAALHPTAGAVVVGARKFLIAYNVNLGTPDVSIAKRIAKTVRASSGGLPCVKGMGVMLEGRGIAQVSMNLTDYEVTPMHVAYEAVAAEAAKEGVDVVGSEIVGLVPAQALESVAAHALKVENFSSALVLENRLAAALDEQTPAFSEMCAPFLDALAAKSAVPGGGCAAAQAIAMGANLGLMAIRVTRGKKRYQEYEADLAAAESTLAPLEAAARSAIDRDAAAFGAVMAALNLPKEREDLRTRRAEAVTNATIGAARVPMENAETGVQILRALRGIDGMINVNAASDLKVATLVCEAGVRGAIENVQINLSSIEDAAQTEELGRRAGEVVRFLDGR